MESERVFECVCARERENARVCVRERHLTCRDVTERGASLSSQCQTEVLFVRLDNGQNEAMCSEHCREREEGERETERVREEGERETEREEGERETERDIRHISLEIHTAIHCRNIRQGYFENQHIHLHDYNNDIIVSLPHRDL